MLIMLWTKIEYLRKNVKRVYLSVFVRAYFCKDLLRLRLVVRQGNPECDEEICLF